MKDSWYYCLICSCFYHALSKNTTNLLILSSRNSNFVKKFMLQSKDDIKQYLEKS